MNKTEVKKLLDECDWSELDGHGWAELLQWQPQLADKRDRGDDFAHQAASSLVLGLIMENGRRRHDGD